jgi:hypothetical protein
MAYMSQEKKKAIEVAVKPILVKYGVKGRLGVDNHSTLVLQISSGSIDFIGSRVMSDRDREYIGETTPPTSIQVNVYHIDRYYSGKAKDFLLEVKEAMMAGNHNNSDAQTDHFDVGWYVDINIGKWDKPVARLANHVKNHFTVRKGYENERTSNVS